jgi:hypothetical protein
MVDKLHSNSNPILNAAMDRREAIERSLRFGAGLMLIGMLPASLSGCAVEGALEPTAAGNTGLVGMSLTPAPDAEILLAPYKVGDLLDEQYKFVTIERAQDKHLRICLVDIKHGGTMEIELFRHAADGTRPVAATEHWEFYTYNAAKGDSKTPSHVKDVISHLATNISEIENHDELLSLNKSVALFSERTF